MKQLFLFLSLHFTSLIYAQLTVSPYNNGTGNNGTGSNLQQFVQTNLVGSGITISNVTFTGANRQMGSFNSTNTVLFTNQGMDNGIILSTGEAKTAIGPNDEPYACGIGGYIGNTSTDPDLQILAGSSIKDKAILEFDFIPQGPSIEFKYIFGSEEYPEYVGSSYNDAFGFFLSGPGISGTFSNNATNLALIPNTSIPVTINNVNAMSNSAYFVYNGDPGNGTTIAPYRNNPQYIEYDGYTVSLTAKAQVQCGQTYHLKIAIGDASDQSYDSGVFLKGGSLFSEAPVDISLLTGTAASDDVTLVRGCSGTNLVFTRSSGLDSVLTVNYQTSGSAVSGVDYTPIPNPVVFQTGQDSVVIPVTALPSGSGLDSLIITMSQSNSCGQTSSGAIIIRIQDPAPIQLSAPDVTIPCTGNTATLTATASGGATPYTYSWSNGANGSSTTITVTSSGTQQYYVTATDACGSQKTDTVTVTFNEPSIIDSLTATHTIACSNTGSVTAYTSNVSGNAVYTWSGPGTNSSNVSHSTVFNNLSSGWYYFSVQDNGCTDKDSIFVQGINSPSAVIIADKTQGCSPATFVLSNGSTNSTTYYWNTGSGYYPVSNQDAQTVTLTSDRNIYLIASDGSCSDTTMISLTVHPLPDVNTSPDQTICAGASVSLTANGADTYIWTPATGLNTTTSSTVAASPSATTTYAVTGTSSFGCTGTSYVTITVLSGPDANFTPSVTTGEAPLEVVFENTSINAVSYIWNFGNGQSSTSSNLNVSSTYSETGIYEVILVASNGECKDTAKATISVTAPGILIHVPNVFTPNGDNVNDEFYIGTTNAKTVYVEIYNRWGNTMVRLEKPADTWDGGNSPDGVYFYKYKITDFADKLYEGHGFFHLERGQ
ncbi:MAG: choice-of-anchor L domain-containing protein [Flavobacteriia bacterium]|nr:choice-of-anchor L domain-containing protein [Flavobacteriia bacterium]OJX36737.1 MAG: hypothetical protein BGO87_13165 [Flavobacteriia bacterium 40-80]